MVTLICYFSTVFLLFIDFIYIMSMFTFICYFSAIFAASLLALSLYIIDGKLFSAKKSDFTDENRHIYCIISALESDVKLYSLIVK